MTTWLQYSIAKRQSAATRRRPLGHTYTHCDAGRNWYGTLLRRRWPVACNKADRKPPSCTTKPASENGPSFIQAYVRSRQFVLWAVSLMTARQYFVTPKIHVHYTRFAFITQVLFLTLLNILTHCFSNGVPRNPGFRHDPKQILKKSNCKHYYYKIHL